MHAYAGDVRSEEVTVDVHAGPAVELLIREQPPSSVQSGAPIRVLVSTGDADRCTPFRQESITASIATGSGTLSGTTTRTGSYDTAFDDRRTDGTSVFTLRFDTPGLPSVVTSPITVTPPPG
jgi:hypothetical protein